MCKFLFFTRLTLDSHSRHINDYAIHNAFAFPVFKNSNLRII